MRRSAPTAPTLTTPNGIDPAIPPYVTPPTVAAVTAPKPAELVDAFVICEPKPKLTLLAKVAVVLVPNTNVSAVATLLLLPIANELPAALIELLLPIATERVAVFEMVLLLPTTYAPDAETLFGSPNAPELSPVTSLP